MMETMVARPTATRRVLCLAGLVALLFSACDRRADDVPPPPSGGPRESSRLRPKLPVRGIDDFELSGPVATVEYEQWDVTVKNGQEVREESGSGGQRMGFDAQGRLVRYEFESDGTWIGPTAYEYSTDGLLSMMADSQGGAAEPSQLYRYEYAWDDRSLILTARDTLKDVIVWRELQLFDDHGRVTEVSRSRGDDLGFLESKHDYSYDDAGRVSRDVVYARKPGGTLVPARVHTYRYDDLGRLAETSRRMVDGEELDRSTYRYDGDSRLAVSEDYYVRSELVSVTRFAYVLDFRDNWVEKRWSSASLSTEFLTTRTEERRLAYHTE